MQQLFYDTCSLLNELHHAFQGEEKFLISSFTLKELENIKTSSSKDAETKFKARRLMHLLDENESKYEVVLYDSAWDKKLPKIPVLSDNNDSRIILSALEITKIKQKTGDNIIFVTSDLCCKRIALAAGLDVLQSKEESQSDYKGFVVLNMNSTHLANFYESINEKKENYGLLVNEYLIICDENDEYIDCYKWTEDGFKKVPYNTFESKMFGKVKPKDIYQQIAMDSMRKNKLTMIRGAAGTGKSYLSFGYLFYLLEKHEIEKIIIFCNTVATSGSAKLGYYPGSRDEKLLDSQIGNLLASKLGDKSYVERMIAEGDLILLPMSDIRGYDTTGMKAGIYISEAQNLDIELMRLALQRIGEDSICILDGDSDAQVDLSIYGGNNNGMRRVSEIFRGDPVYGEVTLQNIHRSRIARLAQQL